MLRSTIFGLAVVALPLAISSCADGPDIETSISRDQEASSLSTGSRNNRANHPAPRTVYISHRGTGNIAAFAIDDEGRLVPIGVTPASPMSQSRGLVITPDGHKAFMVNTAPGTVSSFSVGTDGKLTAIASPVPTDPSSDTTQPFGISVAPNGRWVYISNAGTSTVSVFAIRKDHLHHVGSWPTGGVFPRGIAVSSDGTRVYVANRDTDSVSAFEVQHDGALRLIGQPVVLADCPTGSDPDGSPLPGCSPFWPTFSPDGRRLYISNQLSGDLATFSIRADGGLEELPGRIKAGGRPESMAISADGRFLYSSSIDSNTVWVFSIGVDGRLTFLDQFPTCDTADIPASCGAVSSMLTPDGHQLYVANAFNDTVASFAVEPNGLLRALGASLPTGAGEPAFGSLAILPNQGPTARLSRVRDRKQSRDVSFDASESFDPDGHVARYDWDFGDGQTRSDGGPTVTHTYTAPGTYSVTVMVTDNEGCSATFLTNGQTPACNATQAARARRTVRVL